MVDLARYLLGEVSVMCASQADLVISARYPDADIADVNLALLRFASGDEDDESSHKVPAFAKWPAIRE